MITFTVGRGQEFGSMVITLAELKPNRKSQLYLVKWTDITLESEYPAHGTCANTRKRRPAYTTPAVPISSPRSRPSVPHERLRERRTNPERPTLLGRSCPLQRILDSTHNYAVRRQGKDL